MHYCGFFCCITPEETADLRRLQAKVWFLSLSTNTSWRLQASQRALERCLTSYMDFPPVLTNMELFRRTRVQSNVSQQFLWSPAFPCSFSLVRGRQSVRNQEPVSQLNLLQLWTDVVLRCFFSRFSGICFQALVVSRSNKPDFLFTDKALESAIAPWQAVMAWRCRRGRSWRNAARLVRDIRWMGAVRSYRLVPWKMADGYFQYLFS